MLFILLNIRGISGEFKIQQYQDLVVDDLFLMMLVSIFITIPCCCYFCSFRIILKHPLFCWSMRSVGQLALYLNIIRGTKRDLVVYQKQECRKAQAAEIRSQGYFWSIFRRRSPAEQLMFQKSEPPRLRSHSRFWMRTSLKVRPGKRLLPKRRWQKIAPILNTSAIGVLLVDISLMLMISGATNPGVPHLTNRQLGSSATVANPKSTITGQFDSFLNMIFSGLRSLWITFFLAIQAIPLSSPLKTCLVSASENLCLVIILVYNWEPYTYSRMRQIELSDSNTPSIFMRLGWSNIRLIFISLMRAGLPFYWEQVAYLAKALMAKCFPSFNLYPRYTEAKLPLPTFLIALKLMLNPLWLISFASSVSHLSISAKESVQNSLGLKLSAMNLIPRGFPSFLGSSFEFGTDSLMSSKLTLYSSFKYFCSDRSETLEKVMISLQSLSYLLSVGLPQAERMKTVLRIRFSFGYLNSASQILKSLGLECDSSIYNTIIIIQHPQLQTN